VLKIVVPLFVYSFSYRGTYTQGHIYLCFNSVALHCMLGVCRILYLCSQKISVFQVYRNEGTWPLRDPFETLQYYRTVLRKEIFENVGGLLVK